MVTVSDLKDQTGIPGPHPDLVCRCCGATYSANRSDYFLYRPTFPFICCDQPMILAVQQLVYQEVGK